MICKETIGSNWFYCTLSTVVFLQLEILLLKLHNNGVWSPDSSLILIQIIFGNVYPLQLWTRPWLFG